MIEIKILRHSNRMDFTYPIKWMFYFGHYWSDSPLTEEGYTNARNKGIRLKSEGFVPHRIYTSPYGRTLTTATEIKASFPQSELVIEPLLAEYQPRYGHSITLYPKGLPTTYDGLSTNFTYPESMDNFSLRIRFIIGKLIEKNDSNILIVTHGEVLKSYITYLQYLFPGLLLDPGSTPYLMTLSFMVVKKTGEIIANSIKLD